MQRGTGPKRTVAERERDLVIEANLYCEGKTLAVIADHISEHRDYTISHMQVFRDMELVRKVWQSKASESVEARRAEECAKIDRLEQEAWQAWYRSLQELQTRTTEAEPDIDVPRDADGKPRNKKLKSILRIEQSWGDPRFLTQIAWCIDRRCKLLGLDKPVEQDAGATLRQMAREVAEIEGLDEEEVMQEAQNIFSGSTGFK